MKVLVADKFEKVGLDGIRGLGLGLEYQPDSGAEGLPDALARVAPEVLVVRSTKVPAGTIGKADGLRLIIRAGAGVDNIDVPAASSRGVAVANCPGMNSVAVAELAFAHLLCCDRRVPDQTAEARAGKWNKKEYSKARGLKGLTLGIVGVGQIGRELARRALAFGMRVLAFDVVLTPERAAAMGCEFGGCEASALPALAARCDAISVHVPLLDSTKKMFGREFFAAMKPGAYFINTSRGGVVDEAALADAVRTKGLRAGLDVHENQPGSPQGEFRSALAGLPGCSLTHHVGASTDQAQAAVAAEVVRILSVFRERGRVENCVNADALGSSGAGRKT